MNTADWRALADTSAGPDGCWTWQGPPGADGYATRWFSDLGRGISVARVVLAERLGRPIAQGMYACHHCDNRMCVNPSHIYEGSPADNARDRARRGRARNGYTTSRLGRPLRDGTIEGIA